MPEAKYTDDSRTIALLPRCRPPCQPTACRNCWAWRLRSTMRAVKFTEKCLLAHGSHSLTCFDV